LRGMLSFAQDRLQLLALFVLQGDDVLRHPPILNPLALLIRYFKLETTLARSDL
jgi:hypothetical protein